MFLVFMVFASALGVFVEPLGWLAISAALICGWFDAKPIALGALVATCGTLRFWFWSPPKQDASDSIRFLVETQNAVGPWIDAGTIGLVILLAYRSGRWFYSLVRRLLEEARQHR
jgi:hypothetical protein